MKQIVVVAVLLLSSCGGESSEQASLSGVVRIGPTPGPCVVDIPCSRPAGDVQLEFSRSGRSPVRDTTDARGRYEVSLEPATYQVRSVDYPLPATLQPATVTVEGDALLNIEIDSGVR